MTTASRCWQEAAVPLPVGLPRELLECPYDMALASPRESELRESKEEGAVSFMIWSQKLSTITSAILYSLEVSY